ncbi:MAG: REP-associated tyrosine transposase [Terriglobia bacterium]
MVQSIEESRSRLGFGLYGYVLMPDHWHVLLWPSGVLTISWVLQDIKYVSARRINRSRRTRGSIWQRQFWDRFVRHAREFSHRLEYMHMNPVRKGLVAKAEEWQWSSYTNFTLDESQRAACPIQIDYVLLPDSYRA